MRGRHLHGKAYIACGLYSIKPNTIKLLADVSGQGAAVSIGARSRGRKYGPR